jgi:hypothetical protein
MTRVALLGLLLALTASSTAGAAAGNPFALHPFLSKARGGASKAAPAPVTEEEIKKIKSGVPLSQQAALTEKESPLVEDIELLSAILAETVNRVNPKIHDIYTQFRKYGLQRYVLGQRWENFQKYYY